MAVQEEKPHAGEFLISEASRSRSRETVDVAAEQTWLPGTLVAQSLVGALAAEATAAAGNTGNGAMGAVTVDANAPLGVYRVVITDAEANAGNFTVERPDGSLDGVGTVGVAYDGSINFTLADGATDFAVNDAFEIEVTIGDADERWVAWEIGLTAGGVSFDHAVTGEAETAKAVIIDGDAEVNGNLLAYPEGATLSEKVEAREQLRRLGIKVR